MRFFLFYYMDINDLISNVESSVAKRTISPYSLLSGMYIPSDDRFLDHRYLPAYYHLGKHISPLSYAHVGFGFGLVSSMLAISCKSIANFVGFDMSQDAEFDNRLGSNNLRMHYKSDAVVIHDTCLSQSFYTELDKHSWDLFVIDADMSYDDYMASLRAAWHKTSDKGLIIIDRVNYNKSAERSYADFCKGNNRDKNIIKSKYGMGIIKRNG